MVSEPSFDELKKFLALIQLTVVSLTMTNNNGANKLLLATTEIENKDEANALEGFLTKIQQPLYEKMNGQNSNLSQSNPEQSPRTNHNSGEKGKYWI